MSRYKAEQVFSNLKAVAATSGGSLNDIVKLNVYLTDLSNFEKVNTIMATHLMRPILPERRLVWPPCRAGAGRG